jgi:hypothetical protein
VIDRLRRLRRSPLGHALESVARLALIGAAVVKVTERVEEYRRHAAGAGLGEVFDVPEVTAPVDVPYEPIVLEELEELEDPFEEELRIFASELEGQAADAADDDGSLEGPSDASADAS